MIALPLAEAPAGTLSTPVHPALADAYEALATLSQRAAADPTSTLAQLRSTHPDVRFSLVTDREAYNGSPTYALILRPPGTPPISLSVGSEQELPWPLRGVQRSSEADLLAVNGTRLDVAEAMVRLDSMLFDPQPMRLLIDGCLLDETLAEEPVELAPGDIQAAADSFRRTKGLHRKSDTQRWLTDRGLTTEDFTAIVVRHAELAALRDRVTAGSVDAWFEQHRSELDTLVVAWIDATAGAEAMDHLVRDPLAAVVHAASTGLAGGVQQLRAGSLEGLVDAAPGGLYQLELEVPAVATVITRESAVLNERTRAEIKQRLFREWLTQRRAAARVTWFWGEQRRTGS